jgi:hypothetical protein
MGARALLLRALAVVGATVACLLLAAPAGAATVTDRPFLFSFDGSDSTAGAFPTGGQGQSVAVDDATHDIYVGSVGSESSTEGGFVSKFDSDGAAAEFTATGGSSLFGFSSLVPVAVDNSGGANQGRLLVGSYGQAAVRAFDPGGTPLWTLDAQAQDVAVDPSGHPWVNGVQYENTGSPPSPTGCTTPPGERMDVDSSGNIYRASFEGITKFTSTGGCTFTESLLDGGYDVSVDQSSPSGHVFTSQANTFNEYDSSAAPLGAYGAQYLNGSGRIAYDPGLDRVYVAQQSEHRAVVAVFGSLASGAVPTVTELAEPSNVGISSAHFSGKVNPENIGATAHFEWKRNGESWVTAARSPAQALTANNVEQPVEFDTDELRGTSTYEVRLVTTNESDKLHAFSAEARTFTTSSPAGPPAVTIEPTSAIGATSATANAEINPQGDTAEWFVELSRGSGCESGSFSRQAAGTIAHGTSAPVSVHYDLTKLMPSEHYCVRFVAYNGYFFGFFGAESAIDQFDTLPVPPSGAETAFAAPRTDTTARVNGRVNPEGERLTYQFEYSEDGGATWKAQPPRVDTSAVRETIVVADDLTDLTPGTTYSYRFHVENPASPASAQGAAKTFTTRTTAEMNIPPSAFGEPERRGIELVNQPDDGNQNVFFQSVRNAGQRGGPISANGEEALWSATGGVPRAPNAAENSLLAQRTPTGWHTRPIAAPAEQQFGEGALTPIPFVATPDFSQLSAVHVRFHEESALVRFDASRTEHLLATFPHYAGINSSDMTTDGAHVLVNNEETRQIEDDGDGSPEVVSIMPDGRESECGTEMEGSSFPGHSNDGSGAGRFGRNGNHGVSTTDASRLYFQVKPNGSCGENVPLALYERNREVGTTTLIDPGAATPSRYEPHFIRATPDGRSAYFTTKSRLDPADTNSGEDVYLWEEAAGASRCLTCEASADADVAGYGGYGGPVMVSNDFSHVYFESERALAPGAEAGDHNIYALSAGAIHFVANIGSGGSNTGLALADLSDDGDVLTFQAVPRRGLTADRFMFRANVQPVCTLPDGSTAQCEKRYLYDEREGSLECLDCAHAGLSSRNSIDFPPGSSLSGDGSTAAFVTPEALVRSDVNRNSDVYEWRNGAVRLVTDGVTSFPISQFATPRLGGVDGDGSNIFFTVAAKLTGFEQFGLTNAYDARIGGGFALPSPPESCSEDACQGPLLSAPATVLPGSALLFGAGNATAPVQRAAKPKPKRCKNGRVRRRVRHRLVCVKHKHHARGVGRRRR